MTPSAVEAILDQLAGQLPDGLADAISDLSFHVARDRLDVSVIRAAVHEAGQGSVTIPARFRALYVGTPLDPTAAADDEAINVDKPTGVILLNASMLRSEQDVLDTVLHEIGHALGYDEDEIAALGLE